MLEFHRTPSNVSLGSPIAKITAGTIIIAVPKIIAEIARVQNTGKLEKEFCDKDAIQFFPTTNKGRKLDF